MTDHLADVTAYDENFVSTAEMRAGLLCAVISGGRPTLAHRPTHKFLPHLEKLGLNGIVWSVAEHDAERYEEDHYPMVVYSDEWGQDYARRTWTDVQIDPEEAFAKGGGLASAGREFACLEAERRGCWGVLQLDDNIVRLAMPRGGKAAIDIVKKHGGLALFVDLLCAVSQSTNSRMTGAQLDAVIAADPKVVRAGFPYSLFIEKVGDGREHWLGAFENDIIQAFQYGSRADGATASIMPLLRYMKRGDKVSKTGVTQSDRDANDDLTGGGLRTLYDSSRSAQLQRMFPEAAKIRVMKTHANGRGDPRVFHKMAPLRNPLRVTDPELFRQIQAKMQALLAEWEQDHAEELRLKVARRGKRLDRMRQNSGVDLLDADAEVAGQ